jgi:hypothetical protein
VTADAHDRPSPHPLHSAAWVLGLALVIVAAVVIWHLATLLSSGRVSAVGDGKDVATYGFTWSYSLIPRAEVVASGMPKDGLPALVLPPLVSVSEVDSLNKAERGKYLVSSDRVIGVVNHGVARAYPLRMLNWHEVANDTLAGRPIAITFNPLCESSVVFARVVAGDTLEFGFSGLLYNSNLLMYDRRPEATGESLWSQLQGRAVAGPAAAAGRILEVLPCAVVTWETWRRWHPATTLPLPAQDFRQRYKRSPYGVYHASDQLRFPVQNLPRQPLPGNEMVRFKERIVAVHAGGVWGVYPLSFLVACCEDGDVSGEGRDGGEWRTTQGGTLLRFVCLERPATIAVFLGDSPQMATSIHSFWFAWYALRLRDEYSVVPGCFQPD